MSKYNEKSKEYTMQYMKENLEEIRFRVKKGKKEQYKNAAEKSGISMAKFFITAADEKIQRDNQQQETPTQPQEPAAPAAHVGHERPSVPLPDSKILEEITADIDLKRLSNDMVYQTDIVEALGMNMLAALLEKARQ